MNWIKLQLLATRPGSIVWSDATAHAWFQFQLLPATDGDIEFFQGDGTSQQGSSYRFRANRSPIVVHFPPLAFLDASDRRIGIQCDREIQIAISTRPDVSQDSSNQLIDIALSIAEQRNQITGLSNQIVELLNTSTPGNTNSMANNCNASIIDSTTEATTLLAQNDNRKGGTIFNNSRGILYIDFSREVDLDNYATRILPNNYYEIPFGLQNKITGIWDKQNGSAFIRELV